MASSNAIIGSPNITLSDGWVRLAAAPGTIADFEFMVDAAGFLSLRYRGGDACLMLMQVFWLENVDLYDFEISNNNAAAHRLFFCGNSPPPRR